MFSFQINAIYPRILLTLLAVIFYLSLFQFAEAATLSLSPNTGVYTSGQTFSVSVRINTEGKPINAAEGTLSFNPSLMSVVSVAKGSLFNLWTAEPAFSNSAGTISFSGGNPAGYTGSAGTVLTITFRANGSGASKLSFSNGAVLAADGKGTNVLNSMNSGSYTISSKATTPEAEVIVEYVSPTNAPAAPKITSATHGDQEAWYGIKEASLSWEIPNGVTAVRTLLDTSPSSVPSKVYDTPIRNINLSDLDEGVSYFHIQFKNSDGWGKITHYSLKVDTGEPYDFNLSLPEAADLTQPAQKLAYAVKDDTSKAIRFLIAIDGGEVFEYIDEEESGFIQLPELEPGHHSVMVEVYDEAGNSTVGTRSLNILSFDKPVFTDYPDKIGSNVIPVIKGMTRPQAKVQVDFTQIGLGVSSADAVKTYEVVSNEEGVFVVIPDGRLTYGVYEISAVAIDVNGARSDRSDTIRVVVAEPGYVRIGSFAVSLLSVVVPLIALVALLIFGIWFILLKARNLRKGVYRESREAKAILVREFSELESLLMAQAQILKQSRKSSKLTKSEEELVDELSHALNESKVRVMKEIDDVTDIVD
ncbi:hypothetical protein KC845_01650 [Candidatus Kaiserbacteria bacterium]|nr:hypothetical protein [Candidatus Kaiserbacteria bacterium]